MHHNTVSASRLTLGSWINNAMPKEAITPAPHKELTFARLLRQT
jgi:hypothetical protein